MQISRRGFIRRALGGALSVAMMPFVKVGDETPKPIRIKLGPDSPHNLRPTAMRRGQEIRFTDYGERDFLENTCTVRLPDGRKRRVSREFVEDVIIGGRL